MGKLKNLYQVFRKRRFYRFMCQVITHDGRWKMVSSVGHAMKKKEGREICEMATRDDGMNGAASIGVLRDTRASFGKPCTWTFTPEDGWRAVQYQITDPRTTWEEWET